MRILQKSFLNPSNKRTDFHVLANLEKCANVVCGRVNLLFTVVLNLFLKPRGGTWI